MKRLGSHIQETHLKMKTTNKVIDKNEYWFKGCGSSISALV